MNALLKPGVKKLPKVVNEVEVLSIRLPSGEWEDIFESIKNDLINFLDQNNIGYAYGSEIVKKENAQKRYFNKVNKYVLNGLKKTFNRLLKSYVESQGVQNNLFNKKQKLTFKNKLSKVGFRFDEVDTTAITDLSEMQQLFNQNSFMDLTEFVKITNDFYAEAYEKYPMPESMTEESAPQFVESHFFQKKKIDRSKLKLLKV